MAFKKELAGSKVRHDEAEATIEVLAETVRKKDAELLEVQEQGDQDLADHAMKALQTSETKLAKANITITGLEAQLQEHQSTASEFSLKLEAQQQQIDSHQARINELLSSVPEAKETSAKLKKANAEATLLQQQLKDLEETKLSLLSAKSTLENAAKKIEVQNLDLLRENADLDRRYTNLKKQRSESEAAILSGTSTQSTKDQKELKDELSKLRGILTGAGKENESLQMDLDDTEEMLDIQQGNLVRLRRELKESREKNLQLTTENKRLLDERPDSGTVSE